jgi:hypothetical protein
LDGFGKDPTSQTRGPLVLLALEIGELRDLGFDLELMGFDGPELGALLSDPHDLPGPRPDPMRDETKQVTCPGCGRVFTT